MVYTEKVDFEWDEKKSLRNFAKHSISFELAITAFDDPFALITEDKKHSSNREAREWLIGESDSGVLVVVFTVRQKKYRLISARRANRKERKLYEEAKRVSF